MDGKIKEEAKDFAGLEVKPIGDTQATDVEIIKYFGQTRIIICQRKIRT